MSRRAGFVTGLLVAGFIAASAHAYRGVGADAVERALGSIPESKEALDAEIARLEAERSAGDQSAKTAYSLAILYLNRPDGYDVKDSRDLLGEAVVADPGYADSVEAWLDLHPSLNDLEKVERGLEERAKVGMASAADAWARGRVAQRRERYGDARQLLAEAERIDRSFAGRVRWALAEIAGETDDDELATTQLGEAVAAVDPVAADLMWRSARLVADSEEETRYKTTVADDQDDFFRGFWKRRDVFPLTAKNERLGEHFRRLREARKSFALESNGNGYLTMHDEFKERSPDLDFYTSDVMFDYQTRISPWLDHRGLMMVRHGKPDRMARGAAGSRSESWLYFQWTSRPLMFHFIERRNVGESVLTLNLAQAMVSSNVADDPGMVVSTAGDFRDLYGTRASFHQLFQQIATAQSRQIVEQLLQQEAQMMGAFVRGAWADETSNLIEKDDILRFATYSVNYRGENGKVDVYAYYAIPELELKDLEGPVFEFDATLVIFSHNWQEQVMQAEHHFRYERPAGKKASKEDLLVGSIELADLVPGRYSFAFQVRERGSDKIGIAKGRFTVDYFGEQWVGLSGLLMADSVSNAEQASIFERNGNLVIPIPTRTIKHKAAAKVYYEIYGLAAAPDGKNHYSIEYQLLQIQEQPGVGSRLFGIGMNIAYIFFPYQIFLAQAGLFGLDVATADPKKGLEIATEERETTPAGGIVSEVYDLPTKGLPAGVYQIYVTVRDHVSGSVSTQKMRFAVAG